MEVISGSKWRRVSLLLTSLVIRAVIVCPMLFRGSVMNA